MIADVDSVSCLWTHAETAKFLRVSIAQLFALNARGEGPRSFKIGNLRRYDQADVRAWLEERASNKVVAE